VVRENRSETPAHSSTDDNKMRSICIVDERGEREDIKREGKKKENNIEGINEGIYVQEREIGNRDSLSTTGVNENTADLCGGAKEEKASRTSLEIR